MTWWKLQVALWVIYPYWKLMVYSTARAMPSPDTLLGNLVSKNTSQEIWWVKIPRQSMYRVKIPHREFRWVNILRHGIWRVKTPSQGIQWAIMPCQGSWWVELPLHGIWWVKIPLQGIWWVKCLTRQFGEQNISLWHLVSKISHHGIFRVKHLPMEFFRVKHLTMKFDE